MLPLSTPTARHLSPLWRELRRGLSLQHSLRKDPLGAVYRDQHRQSLEDPEGFWGAIAEENTVWTKKWDKVLDNSKPPFTKWFVGGRLSVCYNALDRHVEAGIGERPALIWDSPISGNKETRTYSQMLDEVSRMASVLAAQGVGRGDRVLIYMPMIPQAVIAMLATVRLGAIHSVVFGGFAARELATRIKHCQPKVVLTASCGLEPQRVVEYKPLLDDALSLLQAPDVPVILYQRHAHCVADLSQAHKQWDWNDVMATDKRHDCVDIEANEPLYLLYTSGTTGNPKGVQHPAGGHAVVNRWTMKALYGLEPGEVWWAASDLGWIVGHEYICYSPLLNGNTSILYEGKPVGTPDAGQFFRVISEHNVAALFVAPTALRAIHRVDPDCSLGAKYPLEKFRYLFVAGEHCDDETRHWAEKHFKVPALDNWWQTETAHAITASCVGLGNDLNPPRDVSGAPVPGFDVKVLRTDGTEAAPGELGRIVCKLPMPPGTLSTLYQADDMFEKTYFQTYQGYYDTMDAGERDEHGYIKVLARDDDVINVAGHRLSTSGLEEAVIEHEDVVDCAVIGLDDELKGHVPLAMYVVRDDCKRDPDVISAELVQLVRELIGPVAAFRLSVCVPGLPRTRSGKTPRKTLSDMVNGREFKIPPTIEDPDIYSKIRATLQSAGYDCTIKQ